MNKKDHKIYDISKIGMVAKGKKELIKFLRGERLTQRQIIYAKCYDCMGYYADGKVDCLVQTCPLYQLFPYKGKEPNKL